VSIISNFLSILLFGSLLVYVDAFVPTTVNNSQCCCLPRTIYSSTALIVNVHAFCNHVNIAWERLQCICASWSESAAVLCWFLLIPSC